MIRGLVFRLTTYATAELCARGIGLRRETQVGERPLGIVVDDKPRYLVTPDAYRPYAARKRQRRRATEPRIAELAMAHTPKLRFVDPYRRRGRLYLAVCRFSATKAGAWLSANVAWKADPHLLKLTRGRFSTAAPVAAALLESRGARTGQPRRNATLYFHDGGRVTIIASLRGWPRNPAWYYNLRKHPDVVFGGLPFRAEIVEDEAERQRLWDLADRVYPQYADFRELAGKAGRVIPIVQLVPR